MPAPAPNKAFTVSTKHFMQAADYARQTWHVLVGNDVPVDDILAPAAWVHVAPYIKPHALIDVLSEDGHLDMQLRVVKLEDGLVFVRPRFFYENEAARAPLIAAAKSEAKVTPKELVEQAREQAPAGYKCGFSATKKTYWVQLKATGKMLKEGLPTMQAALDFAKAHAAKAAGPARKTVKAAA